MGQMGTRRCAPLGAFLGVGSSSVHVHPGLCAGSAPPVTHRSSTGAKLAEALTGGANQQGFLGEGPACGLREGGPGCRSAWQALHGSMAPRLFVWAE